MNSALANSNKCQPADISIERLRAALEPLPDLAAMYAAEPRVRKTWAERRRAKIGVALLVPLLVLSAVSDPPLAVNSWAGTALHSLAYVLFAAGAAVRVWAMLYIGGRKGSMVVSQGPYSLSRNPLYFGTFLMTLSLFLMLANLTSLLGYLAVSAVYLATTVPSEERRLAAKHGKTYLDYCRHVPRFWPRVSGISTEDSITADIHCLTREARRLLVWIWIPIAGHVLSTLRLESWWPHWLRLP